MSILEIVLLSIGLSMDCLAVSICKAACTPTFNPKNVLRMAMLFGLFQGGMPLIGYFAGISFAGQIKVFDHWIALCLLGFIGGKMIYEGLKPVKKPCEQNKNCYSWKMLLSLSIATSIDALASGIIFVSFPEMIYAAVIFIGIASFLFSLAGSVLGYHTGRHLKFNVEIIGGIILVGIGIKILLEHLMGEG
jgi:putative Mn2+ efflux pump MntP